MDHQYKDQNCKPNSLWMKTEKTFTLRDKKYNLL